MARTTGYTCTGAARLVLNGMYDKERVFPPEFLGEEARLSFMLEHLAQRNIHYRQQIS